VTMRDLNVGDVFRFANQTIVPEFPVGGLYEYHGHGWYGRPYSGGPWCEPWESTKEVVLASDEERMLYNNHVVRLHQKYQPVNLAES